MTQSVVTIHADSRRASCEIQSQRGCDKGRNGQSIWSVSIEIKSLVEDECNANSGKEFAEAMYDAWNKSGLENLEYWFATVVAPLFTARAALPRWRFEPRWLYLDGKPMSFVTQYDHEDRTFYVFEGRRKTKDGQIRVTKLSAQDESSVIIMDGEIVG